MVLWGIMCCNSYETTNGSFSISVGEQIKQIKSKVLMSFRCVGRSLNFEQSQANCLRLGPVFKLSYANNVIAPQT